jgi:hypothetical protein
VEKLSNRRRNLGERVGNDEEVSWIIFLYRYEFKFRGRNFFRRENVKPPGKKIINSLVLYKTKKFITLDWVIKKF